MSTVKFPSLLIAMVIATSLFIICAFGGSGVHKAPDPLPGSTSEILAPVWPGEVLS